MAQEWGPGVTPPDCENCALRAYNERHGNEYRPVPAELKSGVALVIGPAPGSEETERQRPYVGRANLRGVEVLYADNGGYHRSQLDFTYAVACEYPEGGDPKAIARFERRVSSRKRPTEQSPILCCSKRLLSEVSQHDNLIIQGSLATKALLPGNPKHEDYKGGPWPAPESVVPATLAGKKVLVMDTPQKIDREPMYRPINQEWAKKARRWFEDRTTWEDPPYVVNPPIAWLRARLKEWEAVATESAGARTQGALPPFRRGLPVAPMVGLKEGFQMPLDRVSYSDGFEGHLASREAPPEAVVDSDVWVVYDVETDSADPSTARLRCCVFHDGRMRLMDGSPATFILAWRSVHDHPFADALMKMRIARARRDPRAYAGAAKLAASCVPDERVRDGLYSAIREFERLSAFELDDTGTPTKKLAGSTKDRADAADAVRTAVFGAGSTIDCPQTQMDATYAAEVDQWMAEFLDSPVVIKAGWNNRSYDRRVIANHFGGQVPKPEVDLILWHRLCWAHFKHSLWWTGSTLTDVYPWKAEKGATMAPSDEVLHLYNSRDGKVTFEAGVRLPARAAYSGHGLWHYGILQELQDTARAIHSVGMRIIEPVRLRLEAEQELRASNALEIIGQFAPRLNVNSRSQLRTLLYDKLKLPITHVTDTGAPSTADEAIRDLYSDPRTSPEVLPLLRGIRDYLAATKLLNTFIRKFKAGTWHPKKNQWVCDPDGIVRHEYLVFGTAGWRWSSSGAFNAQNIPIHLRQMFGPVDPEDVFVYADQDQLELRLAAALAGAGYYLEAFDGGPIEVHSLSATMIFGEAYWQLEGAPKDRTKKPVDDSPADRRRSLTKNVVYLGIYGGEAGALKKILSGIEEYVPVRGPDKRPLLNADGSVIKKLDFPYARMPVDDIDDILCRWREAAPEFQRWWRDSVQRYRRDGYIKDPVWGLRRYFPNGEEFNKIVNIQVQSGGSAIVHGATLDLARKGYRIAAQTHDALILAVKRAEAPAAAEALAGAMTRRYPHIPVTFKAKAKILEHW